MSHGRQDGACVVNTFRDWSEVHRQEKTLCAMGFINTPKCDAWDSGTNLNLPSLHVGINTVRQRAAVLTGQPPHS
jgi:hypothetical protein